MQHQPSAESFQEDRAGILLPTPTGKQVRVLTFRGGLVVHAEESASEIQRRVGHLRESKAHWMEVTDPRFGETIPISAAAVEDLLFIGDFWLDMEAARREQQDREMQLRLRRLGAQAAPAAQAALPNRAQRREH